jgi:hypothetical protein
MTSLRVMVGFASSATYSSNVAVTLQPGVLPNLQMSETHILIRLLQTHFPQNWEIGSALSKV